MSQMLLDLRLKYSNHFISTNFSWTIFVQLDDDSLEKQDLRWLWGRRGTPWWPCGPSSPWPLWRNRPSCYLSGRRFGALWSGGASDEGAWSVPFCYWLTRCDPSNLDLRVSHPQIPRVGWSNGKGSEQNKWPCYWCPSNQSNREELLKQLKIHFHNVMAVNSFSTVPLYLCLYLADFIFLNLSG